MVVLFFTEHSATKKAMITHPMVGEQTSTSQESDHQQSVVQRLSLPILSGEEETLYELEATQPAIVWNCDSSKEDEELHFKLKPYQPTAEVHTIDDKVINFQNTDSSSLVDYSSSESEHG